MSDLKVRKRLDLGEGQPRHGIAINSQVGNKVASIVDRIEGDPINNLSSPSD